MEQKRICSRISILVTAQTAKNLERLGVHVRIPRNRDGRGQADQRKNDLPAYGRSDAWGKKGETDMGYRCNCPEYEERPCDNLNEELECEECQHGKPEESEEQK